MPKLSAGIKELPKRVNIVVFPEDYFVIYLPIGIKAISGEWFRPATTRFAVVIQEPKTVTMIIPRRKWLRMQRLFDRYEVEGPVKVISFDVKLALVSSGYLSTLGSLLTESGIRSTPISSFRKDHVIVPKEDLPRAVRILRNFLAGNKGSAGGESKKSAK